MGYGACFNNSLNLEQICVTESRSIQAYFIKYYLPASPLMRWRQAMCNIRHNIAIWFSKLIQYLQLIKSLPSVCLFSVHEVPLLALTLHTVKWSINECDGFKQIKLHSHSAMSYLPLMAIFHQHAPLILHEVSILRQFSI